jgi:hypothetical protein
MRGKRVQKHALDEDSAPEIIFLNTIRTFVANVETAARETKRALEMHTQTVFDEGVWGEFD